MRNRKGISPLIATILIVGLTVAIASLIFLFLKGQVNLAAKKGELKFTPNEEAEVQFQVVECKKDGANNLEIKIQNTGSYRIDCFWVAPKDLATKLVVFNMKEGEEDSMKLSDSFVQEVELYPCLIEKDKVKTSSTSVKTTCSGSI